MPGSDFLARRLAPIARRTEDELILVDLADHEVGSCGKLEAHERGLLHRAFSILLFDGSHVLMTRRALGKYHSGGLWTNTCCSHPRVGETVAVAAPRRLREELGITGVACREVGTYCYRTAFANGLVEYELDHILVGEWTGDCQPDPEEVMDWQWVSLDQVVRDVTSQPGRFSAWLPGVLHLVLAVEPFAPSISTRES